MLLYITVFLNIIGFGMIFPVLPFYAQEYGATAFEIGMLAAVFSVAQFLVAPFIGKVSDRIGRKPILILSLFGSSFAFILFSFAPTLWVLFIARALHGVFTAGAFPIASAYIADITKKSERVRYMSKLTAMFSLGFIVGPGISGVLSGFGSSVPFVGAGIVSFLTGIFIVAFLKESLKKKSDVPIKIKDSITQFSDVVTFFRGNLGIYLLILWAWAFGVSNFQVAIPLMAENTFSFSSVEVGYLFSVIGFVSAITQFVVLPRLSNGLTNHRIVALGMIGQFVGQFLIAFSPTAGLFISFISLSVVGGSLLRPTINTILSNETTEGQGKTMGVAFSYTSFGRMIGPVLAGFFISNIGLEAQFVLTAVAIFMVFLLFVWQKGYRLILSWLR